MTERLTKAAPLVRLGPGGDFCREYDPEKEIRVDEDRMLATWTANLRVFLSKMRAAARAHGMSPHDFEEQVIEEARR